MSTFLTNIDDEKGFVKMLLRQMISDGEIAIKEIGYIKGIAEREGVSPEAMRMAREELESGDSSLPKMTKSAIIDATVAIFELSMTDGHFALSEHKNLKDMITELGVIGTFDLDKHLEGYCGEYKAVMFAMEELIMTVGTPVAANTGINKIFTTDEEKKSLMKAMMYIAHIDGKYDEIEGYFLRSIANSFGIERALLEEAASEYDAGNRDFVFESDLAKNSAIRCLIRLACIDSDFDKSEREGILEISKDLGVEVDEAVLTKIADLAGKNRHLSEYKQQIIDEWNAI